jgi:ankyrin repeat domain-containing protein 50
MPCYFLIYIHRATIISYLQNAFPKSDIGIAFIYCNYKEKDKQTVIGLIASLLRQLVERHDNIPDEVQELYASRLALKTRPGLMDYSKILQLIAAKYSKVFLVIDALDESNESHGTRSGLIKEIRKLPRNLHFLCTSRHIPDIEQQFGGSICQEVRASDIDVERYLVERIEQSARLNRHVTADPSLLNAITSNVVVKADGML